VLADTTREVTTREDITREVLADITREVTTREDITEPLVIAPEESDTGIWNSRSVPQQFAEADAEDTSRRTEESFVAELPDAKEVNVNGHWNSKNAIQAHAEKGANVRLESTDYVWNQESFA